MTNELQDKLKNIAAGQTSDVEGMSPPSTSQQTKRKRGRPPKDPNKKTTGASGKPFVLPPQPDPVIANVLKIPFDVWAKSQKTDELKISEAEALQLSAPVKQLMDFYLPQISPIGYVWLSLGLSFSNIMIVKMSIVQKVRAERAKDGKPASKISGKKDNFDNGQKGKRKIDSGKESTSTKK